MKKIKSHQELTKHKDLLIEGLVNESERGLILVSAEALSNLLERLLRLHFSAKHQKSNKSVVDPLLTGLGPLSSFSAKIKLAYAIDLIGESMFKDLETIRSLRNGAAHGMDPVDFDSPSIVKITKKLGSPDIVAKLMMEKENEKLPGNLPTDDSVKTQAIKAGAKKERVRFTLAAAFIGGQLHTKVDELSNSPKQPAP